MSAMAAVECASRQCANPSCGEPLIGRRRDAETCSAKCRKALQRSRLVVDDAEIDDAVRLTACPEDALLVVVIRSRAA